ncbi:hypothetical protein BH10PSE6_BH10PSE6_02850 [soil metagenome]
MLLSPDRGRGWVRGLQGSSAIRLIDNAVPRMMQIGTVNPTEHRPLTHLSPYRERGA